MQQTVLGNKRIFYEISNIGVVDKYALLKVLSKQAFGVDVIIKKKKNKPYIYNYKDIFCSVSDSHDLVFVAVCRGFSIGIDVEHIRQRKKELLSYISNVQEINNIANFLGFTKNIETIVWSLKESVQKNDTQIFSPKEYNVYISGSLLVVKRGKYVWKCILWVEKGNVFSVSVKIS